ncbi:hypothetical protein ABZW30_08940 [Kitasatospora sp. NPDC004669]|uniref:hypothetical protein n=1 Tax=Kitasatospora sp. NPDC004669 TaxID=3154555 RepID=UPI0033BF155A
MATDGPRLPMEFLLAVAADAEPESAAATVTAEQVHGMAEAHGRQYGQLLEALLRKPYQEKAPAWLLETAVTNGLRQAAESEYLLGTTAELVALALAHPDCGESMRTEALLRCPDSLLGTLGTAGRPAVLTGAVAAELCRRVPQRCRMTPDLIKEPTPAQLVLRTERLHDDVFDAAVALLPDAPDRTRLEGEDYDSWSDQTKATFSAWERMWKIVLERHPDHHVRLVETAVGTAANHVIRDQLLGSLPWMVEPGLLRRIALDDLSRFGAAMLVTRVCRFLLDGGSKEETRQHFAAELADLDDSGRREVDLYLEDDVLEAKWGTDTATFWVRHAADGPWRLVLNPAEAKPSYGDPYTWLMPAEELADLGLRFAETAVKALQTWQPKDSYGISKAADLRWVHAMLIHLPEVTPAVRKTVQIMIRDARRGQARPRSYDYRAQEDHRQFTGLLDAISRIVADPLPQAPATRRAALGDPAQVTPRSLSGVTPEVLDEYLDRHTGDDQIVEKALLSFAWRSSYQHDPSFTDVLARHSNPQQAVHTLTHELRRRLGGNPANREAWAQHILALPGCRSETILALPAWTALKSRGSHNGRTHPTVLALVADVLGDDRQAWRRLTESPISHSGPNAWLRLGDILNAAADDTGWPKPPASR